MTNFARNLTNHGSKFPAKNQFYYGTKSNTESSWNEKGQLTKLLHSKLYGA